MTDRPLLPIWVIAKISYKEVIRDRLLYGILLVAALITASSFFMGTISFNQNARVLQNVGLASILIFAAFITIFVTTTSINKDFERRALYLLFPKPISRGQYVLGKYLGMILLLLTTLIILGGLFLIGAVLTDRTVVLGSLMNLGYAFLEVSFLISLAVLFSTFTASLNAALYTIALFIIGHSLLTLKNYVAQVGTSVSRGLVDAAYYLLPNLEKFDIRQAVLYGIHIPAAQVWWTVVYWLVYTGLVLFLSILVIRKQEV